MKKSIFRFCLLASITLCSVACSRSEKLLGNEFLIEGEISGIEDGIIISLMRWDESVGKRITSDTLKNGRFTFKEEAESSTDKLSISPQGDGFPPMSLYVWTAPGAKIKIKGNGKLHPLWEVKSSVPYQKEQNLYTDKSRDIITESARISAERNDAISKIMTASSRDESIPYRNIVDSLDVIRDSLMVIEYSAYVDIFEKTNISPIWLEKMRNLAWLVEPSKKDKGYYGELRKKVETLYGKMSEEDKNTSYGAYITAKLFPPTVVGVGDDFVDADFFDINGNTKHLSDYLGKYLLLDFWSSGCGPCIMALPEMKEISETYKEKLIIVSISLDTDVRWKEAMEKHDTPWANIRDPKAYGGLAANYGVSGIPNYVMISPEGKVVDKWMGYGSGYLKSKVSENIK
jgi:thiol-disulfide isomerase/thioredoxin